MSVFARHDIATPTFSLVKKPSAAKRRGAKRDAGADEPPNEGDDSAEDISDAAIARTHLVYEKLERKLHADFFAKRRLKAPAPPAERDVYPDVFIVRFDQEELHSDPLPPLPRIVRTPARFLDGAVVGAAAMKRAGAHVVIRLPKDLSSLLPLQLGVLSIMSLGRIVNHPAYWTERYLFPAGFMSEREYVSAVDPSVKTIYRCEIREGPAGPSFHVIARDDADNPVIAESPSKCWSEVMRRVNAARVEHHQRPVYTAISGPEYFGISKPRVAALFEQLEGAEHCVGYQVRFPPSLSCGWNRVSDPLLSFIISIP